jgi:hypothetical protein
MDTCVLIKLLSLYCIPHRCADLRPDPCSQDRSACLQEQFDAAVLLHSMASLSSLCDLSAVNFLAALKSHRCSSDAIHPAARMRMMINVVHCATQSQRHHELQLVPVCSIAVQQSPQQSKHQDGSSCCAHVDPPDGCCRLSACLLYVSRYNDIVVAGADVPGRGPAALRRNDTVTKRFQEAADAGLNTLRMFASQGQGSMALETSPGAAHQLRRLGALLFVGRMMHTAAACMAVLSPAHAWTAALSKS